MKALFRILMICGAIALIGFMFFNTPKENEPLEGPNTNSNIIPQTELKQPDIGAMTRPQTGISTLIGKGKPFWNNMGYQEERNPPRLGMNGGSIIKIFLPFL